MATARLRRRARLREPAEFKHAFANGRRSSSGCFTVIAVENSRDHARIGIAVARRNVQRAVDRNRLKRIIREVFRLHQGDLAGFDLVVTARRGAAALSNEDVRVHLQRLLAHRQWERS